MRTQLRLKLGILMMSLVLVGCGESNSENKQPADDKQPRLQGAPDPKLQGAQPASPSGQPPAPTGSKAATAGIE